MLIRGSSRIKKIYSFLVHCNASFCWNPFWNIRDTFARTRPWKVVRPWPRTFIVFDVKLTPNSVIFWLLQVHSLSLLFVYAGVSSQPTCWSIMMREIAQSCADQWKTNLRLPVAISLGHRGRRAVERGTSRSFYQLALNMEQEMRWFDNKPSCDIFCMLRSSTNSNSIFAFALLWNKIR